MQEFIPERNNKTQCGQHIVGGTFDTGRWLRSLNADCLGVCTYTRFNEVANFISNASNVGVADATQFSAKNLLTYFASDSAQLLKI